MIAVTGSSGLIGRGLLALAGKEGTATRAVPRKLCAESHAFEGCQAVIHLAGLAHRKTSKAEEFMQVNCDLALSSAQAARQAGTKRFIYVSSSKALCDFANDEHPLSELEPARPVCAYGHSKRAAEVKLLAMHESGRFEVIIVRPALVAGAPAKANMESIARLALLSVQRPVVGRLANLFFSGFQSSRSLTGLQNLCSALLCLAASNRGGGEIFHVVDDRPLSTNQLFQALQRAADPNDKAAMIAPALRWARRAILQRCLEPVFWIAGRHGMFQAMARPCVLDGSKIQREMSWKPTCSLDAELQHIQDEILKAGETGEGEKPLQ